MGMTIKAHKYRRLKPSDTASITGAIITAPTLTAVTITGTSTIGTGMTLTTPVINTPTITAPAITGTSTIGSGMTITSPTITSPAITGTSTIGAGMTLTSPIINTPTIKDLTEVVTTANVITAAETGTVFFLNNAAGFASTLPAVASSAGVRLTFIVQTQPTSGALTVVGAAATPIIGGVHTLDVNSATDPSFSVSGVLTLLFVNSKAVVGDSAEFFCNGTNWFVTAHASVFDGITLA